MDGRDSKKRNAIDSKAILPKTRKTLPITIRDIKGVQPSYTYFLRKQAHDVKDSLPELVTTAFKSLHTTISQTKFSSLISPSAFKSRVERAEKYFFDTMQRVYDCLNGEYSGNRNGLNFRKFIWPAIASGAALLIGELATERASRHYYGSDEYDFVFKAAVGALILGYSSMHRITDQKIKSEKAYAVAVASEVTAIFYLYYATFRTSRMMFDGRLNEDNSLIASLTMSGLVVPGTFAYAARTYHNYKTKQLRTLGAQRSDTALISAGMTEIANTMLRVSDGVVKELLPASRQFQLGLISQNISTAKLVLEKFKNGPALFADIGPSVYKRERRQLERISRDYGYNTTKQKVLRFEGEKSSVVEVERYQLRTGDLVFLNVNFDHNSSPISGELVALAEDEKGAYTNKPIVQEYLTNLIAKNGEDVWLRQKTNASIETEYKQVELQYIKEKKQPGVLTGSKINVLDKNNAFLRVKEEKEKSATSEYEKTAVINDYIIRHKNQNVKYALVASIASAILFDGDLWNTTHWMFNLYQMMIPFAETFLRDSVNKSLLSGLNKHLPDQPMEITDALRVVGFILAAHGYFADEFKNGAAMVSDKTGTLTTSKMIVRGIWDETMRVDVQNMLQEEKENVLPQSDQLNKCLKYFAAAFTGSKKEEEPEEAAMRTYMKGLDKKFTSEEVSKNHLKKTYIQDEKQHIVHTYHLGLYGKFGGRLTLVEDNGKYQLVFCGVPRGDNFTNTPLLKAYQTMQQRIGVLSRDWCLASVDISEADAREIKELFLMDKQKNTEAYFCSKREIFDTFKHHSTFIIDNPVKKDAEKFISRCEKVNVPVFIATGDSAKAAENIARVLAPEKAKKLHTIREANVGLVRIDEIAVDSTVIFSGTTGDMLSIFGRLLERDPKNRPVIIFSEMSPEGKGVLVQYLKNNGFYVAANGDGANDLEMMAKAHTVFAHLADNGTYSHGVDQFSDLNDRQLQRLCESDKSFYELFDIEKRHSLFVRLFARLANSQEKPERALTWKSSKMGMSMTRFFMASNVGNYVSRGLNLNPVMDMPMQHWAGIAYDLMWLLISRMSILWSADMPADEKNIMASEQSVYDKISGYSWAILQAVVVYSMSNESVNANTMLCMLSFLFVALNSAFFGYGDVHERVNAEVATLELLADDEKVEDSKAVVAYRP